MFIIKDLVVSEFFVTDLDLLVVLNSDDVKITVEIVVIQGLVFGLVVVGDSVDVKIVVVVSLKLVEEVIAVD